MPVEKVVLELFGSEADGGLPLQRFESFVDNFRRSLVDHYRQTRAEPTRRGGHPNVREELVTAFKLVGFRPGSAVVELEPLIERDADRPTFADAETLAVENLRSLLDAIEGAADLHPDVAESLDVARRSLGNRGRIGVVLAGGGSLPRRVEIDEARMQEITGRSQRIVQEVTRVTGLLHMIDVDPKQIAIRTGAGIEWFSEYSPDLERKVLALLKSNVWATGRGQLTSRKRGEFVIEEIEPVPEFEQTDLFTVERKPIAELRASQHVHRPQGWDVFADPDWQDDEASARYLDAVLQPEPPS